VKHGAVFPYTNVSIRTGSPLRGRRMQEGYEKLLFWITFYVGKKLCCRRKSARLCCPSSTSRAQSFIIVNKRKCVSVVILSSYASGNRYIGDGDTDRREILHDGRCQSRTDFLSFEGTPKGPQIQNFDREYLENGKSQRYMGRSIGSTRVFQKCVTSDISPLGSPL